MIGEALQKGFEAPEWVCLALISNPACLVNSHFGCSTPKSLQHGPGGDCAAEFSAVIPSAIRVPQMIGEAVQKGCEAPDWVCLALISNPA